MKVNCYLNNTLTEKHVDIYCREKDSKIEGIIRYINAYTVITGRNEEMTVSILPNNVLIWRSCLFCETATEELPDGSIRQKADRIMTSICFFTIDM